MNTDKIFSNFDTKLIQNNIKKGESDMNLFSPFYESYVKLKFDEEVAASKTSIIESLLNKVSQFIISLNNIDDYKKILNELALEITDASYSQSDYNPNTQDYVDLVSDFRLKQITFYIEEIALLFEAKNNFPDMIIFCQIDEYLDIQDVNVVES